MKIDEFLQATNRLAKFYGKQDEMEQYEKDIWYQELKTLNIKRYEQIIKKAFVECKFMPKLADIVAIHRALPYDEKTENEKVECKICKGNGFIIYRKEVGNGDKKLLYDYTARCTCKNGDKYKYDSGKWYIPSIAQLGF